MKTLTVRDQEIYNAQGRVAEARSRLHSLAPLGDPQSPEYLEASRELDEALAALTAAFGLPEEFDCARCGGKWDGKGRVVISTIHVTIHSKENGRVIEEYEFSTGNQRHLVECPNCAAPLTQTKQKKVKVKEGEEEVEKEIEVRAIGEYFSRR